MSVPSIALLTDFGLHDVYAGILKGVILSIAPGVPLVDVSHTVPRGQIQGAAYLLYQAAPFFPAQTVFLAVVDPGVGSSRRPLAVQTRRATYVGPDNGIFTYVMLAEGTWQAVQLQNTRYRLPEVSSTFHGRDVFAPAAAHLASGLRLEELGPVVADPVRLPLPRLDVSPGRAQGEVIHIDVYGNVATSIGRLTRSGDACTLRPWLPGVGPVVEFDARTCRVHLASAPPLPLTHTFAGGESGQPIALINSSGHLELAVNGGSAAEQLGIDVGDKVELEIES